MEKVSFVELVDEFADYVKHSRDHPDGPPFVKRYAASTSLSQNVSQLILLGQEGGSNGDNSNENIFIPHPDGTETLNWDLLTRENLLANNDPSDTDEVSMYSSAAAALHRMLCHAEDREPLQTLVMVGRVTSQIEDTLASLCSVRVACVPRVLRDILALPELEEVLGADRLFFVKLLVGPPVGLNIRNVYWHGFFSPGEVPCVYARVLRALLASLRALLPENARQRPRVSLSEVQPHLFDEFSFVPYGPSFTKDDAAAVSTLFRDSVFVIEGREKAMATAVGVLLSQTPDKEDALVLVFPQIEHCLRRAFVAVNGLPYSTMSPDYRTYYTTLDIILQSEVVIKGSQLVAKSAVVGKRFTQPKYAKKNTTEDKDKDKDKGEKEEDKEDEEEEEEIVSENKLVELLGEGTIMLLSDLLTHQNGLKIRDITSHGTLDLSGGLDPAVSRAVAAVAVALAAKMTPYKGDRYPPWVLECGAAVDGYRSKFHPVSKAINSISDAFGSLCRCRASIEESFRKFGENGDTFGEYASQRGASQLDFGDFVRRAEEMCRDAGIAVGEDAIALPKICALYCTTERISAANMCGSVASFAEKFAVFVPEKFAEFAEKEESGSLTKRGQKTFYKLCGCVDAFADMVTAVVLLAAKTLVGTDCKREGVCVREEFTKMKKCSDALNRAFSKLQEYCLDDSLTIMYKYLDSKKVI